MKSKKKTMKSKKKTLTCLKVPILNDEYKVYILYGDADKAIRWVNRYYGEHYDVATVTNVRGKAWSQRGLHPAIWVNLSEAKPFHIYATVAHEATHAINDLFDEIKETSSAEVYSHSVGAIVYAFEKHFRGASRRVKGDQ